MARAVEKNFGAKKAFLLTTETGGYADGTPALSLTTDGIITIEPVVVKPDYQYDGSRPGESTGGYSGLYEIAPAGRFGTATAKWNHRAPGSSVFTGSVWSQLHHLLRAHGYSATFSGTPKWRYAPISSGRVSAVAEAYWAGQKAALKGALVSAFGLSFDGKSIPELMAELRGIMTADLNDTACPTVTYPTRSTTIPSARGMIARLGAGGQTADLRVKSLELKSELTLDDREDTVLTNGEHCGWSSGPHAVSVDMVVEARTRVAGTPFVSTASGQFDPDQLFSNRSGMSVLVNYGAGAGNQLEFGTSGSTARLITAPEETRDGSIMRWKLSLGFRPADDEGEIDFYLDTL
jgi:hypothetical protein